MKKNKKENRKEKEERKENYILFKKKHIPFN